MKLTRVPAHLLFTSLLAALLTGCATSPPNVSLKATPLSFSGSIHGGQQPVAGVSIQLYAVGASGDGSASTPLGPLVTSTASGNFTLGAFTCPTPFTLVYLLGTGGNPIPNTPNAQLALMAALGPCNSIPAFVDVNELTTVAAVYALEPFMNGPTAVGSSTSDTVALNASFALAAEYVNSATGLAPGTGVPSGYTVPTAQIATIANILATCINSAGSASVPSAACASFFSLTLPTGSTRPNDAVSALLNLAAYPEINTSALYLLAIPASPFQPMDLVQPPDLNVALTGPNLPATFDNPNLNFQTIGVFTQSAPQTTTLFNNGPTVLAIYQIWAGYDFTETDNCPYYLPVSGSCTFSVVANPPYSGPFSGNLQVAIAYPDRSTQTLTATLSGTAVSITTTGSAQSLTLAPTPIGVTSPPQTLVVENTTSIPVAVNSIFITGHINGWQQFAQTNTCPAVLATGGTCVVTVTATPTSSGPFSGILVVSCAGDASLLVALVDQGTTSSQALMPSTSELYVPEFPDVGVAFLDLTNTGTVPVTNISPGLYYNFYSVHDGCGSTLAPGATCQYIVSTRQSNGVGIDLLNIYSSAPGSPLPIYLGSDPGKYDFGPTPLGTQSSTLAQTPCIVQGPACQVYGSLTSTDFAFSDNPTDSSCTSPGCSLTASFAPLGSGYRIGRLYTGFTQNTISGLNLLVGFGVPPNSQNTLSVVPATLTFPDTPVGGSPGFSPPQTFVVSNPAGHLLDIAFDGHGLGTAVPQFKVTPAFCAATTCMVTVSFIPTTLSTGYTPASGSLLVVDTVTNQALLPKPNFSGYAGDNFFSYPQQPNFYHTPIGQTTSSEPFYIQNNSSNVEYLSFSLPVGPTAGPGTSDYIASAYALVLAPGSGAYTPGYQLQPTQVGDSAVITVTDTRNGTFIASLPLAGFGDPSSPNTMTLNASALAFSPNSNPQTVILTNHGTAPILFTTVVTSSGFSQTNNCTAFIPPLSSCSIVVTNTSPGASGYMYVVDADITDLQQVTLTATP